LKPKITDGDFKRFLVTYDQDYFLDKSLNNVQISSRLFAAKELYKDTRESGWINMESFFNTVSE